MKTRLLRGIPLFISVVGLLLGAASLAENKSTVLALWSASGPNTTTLKTWSLEEIAQLKPTTSSEKDSTGRVAQWKGTLLSKWVEKTLETVPLAERAAVDLLLIKNSSGVSALVPRYLVTKYPFLLAYQKDQQPVNGGDGPLAIVVPVKTKPAILSERVPLNTYAVTAVSTIELTSYQARFHNLILKRRTDPAAIRGEKLFVQNCIACHATGRAKPVGVLSKEGTARSLASGGHPQGEGVPELREKDTRALVSYLNAYRLENPN